MKNFRKLKTWIVYGYIGQKIYSHHRTKAEAVEHAKAINAGLKNPLVLVVQLTGQYIIPRLKP